MLSLRTLVGVTATLILGPALALAQVPDHLKCYKVKDPLEKAKYTADLGGLTPEPGCMIKAPAIQYCVETTKTNVVPSPPGAPAGPPAGRFVCYKVKCDKSALAPVPVVDQFGARDLELKAPKILCAPVITCPPTVPPATTIPPGGGTVTGSTVGGVVDDSCSVGNFSPQRFFHWTPATSGAATVMTCGGITDYQSRLTMLDECDGDPSFGLACTVGATCGDNLAGRLNVSVLAGVTYTIIVAGDNGSAGNFTLTVTQP
jgi:hypothetical protein